MAKWRFEKEGKPLLQAGESPKSFKQRVAAWEKRTGREYVPMEFGEEEKILSGKTLIGGWGNQTDYFSNDSLVNEQNIKAAMEKGYVDPNDPKSGWKEEAIYARSIERDKEMDRMAENSETDYDQGSIQYAVDEYNKKIEQGLTGIPLKDVYNSQMPDLHQESLNDLAIFDQKTATDRQILVNSAKKKQTVNEATNNAYTTNFKEAMRQADKTQAWEDTIDGDAPLEKSNVFSKAEMDWGMYKEGDTLGVMTRRQRRAYDEAVSKARAQAAMDQTPEYSDQSEFQGGDGVLKPETKPKEMAPNTAEVKVDEQKPDLTIQQMFGVTPKPEAPIEYDENLLNKLGSMFSPRSR